MIERSASMPRGADGYIERSAVEELARAKHRAQSYSIEDAMVRLFGYGA